MFLLFPPLAWAQKTAGQKLSKEETAIRQVIESESKHFWGRNYQEWKKLYVHAPYVTRTISTKDGVRQLNGWDVWDEEVKELFDSSPNPQPYEGIVYKYNYRYRVYGNGAWVTFEQMNDGVKTLETRILEKENGQWKIAMVQVIFNVNELVTATGDTDTDG
jgi:hypothetical protein